MRLVSKSALIAAALSTALAGAALAGPSIGGTTSHAGPTIAKRVVPKPLAAQAAAQTTSPFNGAKVNGGTATSGHNDAGRLTLTLSDDFKVPNAPAPHWQVVDTDGNTYLLERLVIKGDAFHKQITVPRYVKDVAKVQIWCAYAEVLLGEAPFASPAK